MAGSNTIWTGFKKRLWASDIDLARESDRAAVYFGFQNPSPIGDDRGARRDRSHVGVRFIQLINALTEAGQELLASLILEPYGEKVDSLVEQMVDRDTEHFLPDGRATVAERCWCWVAR